MFLNSKIKHGVKALLYFSKLNSNEIISAAKIAAELSVPKEFISKIMQSLVYHGILKSKKGKGGGFYLAVSPDKIKYEDVFRILGYNENYNSCLFDMVQFCENKGCPFCDSWKEFTDRFNNILRNYSLTGNLMK
ncbi:MAG: Rrf2 family transcriptional regulator [Melioribacter sp.]|uniref:RrF2 family transcriptional regulator n=1 Tax=Rosettibacter primus TaxID=3111523 RepID=UPI00247BF009|nr:Rrf2 family transcriptional regulator [Melioribacter sp.]